MPGPIDVAARKVVRPHSMVRWLVVLVGVLAAFSRPLGLGAQEAESARTVTASSAREMLDRYCVRCHNDATRVAGLALDTRDLANVSAEAETWERVIVKLRAQTMPPAGNPRPDQATYRAAATWLESRIDAVALTRADPGRGETFHRLNRAEYHAAVRDLLAVDVDVASLLPADNTYEHGFDNNAEIAVHFAGPGIAIPLRRSKDQSSRRGDPSGRTGRRQLSRAPGSVAGRSSGRHALLRVTWRRGGPALLSGGRRVHHQGSPAQEFFRLHHRLFVAARARRKGGW